jgi:hypothetical protein
MVVLWLFAVRAVGLLSADSVFRMAGILLFSICHLVNFFAAYRYITPYLHLVTHHHSTLFVSGNPCFLQPTFV